MTTAHDLFALQSRTSRALPPRSRSCTRRSLPTLLGPGARFQTDVLGVGHLRPGGVWHGNLYLRGDGDPTFGDGAFNRIYEDGYGPTAAQLVAQLRRRRNPAGDRPGDRRRVAVRHAPRRPADRLSARHPGLRWRAQRARLRPRRDRRQGYSPAAFAARELVLTMRSQGIRPAPRCATGMTPAGAISCWPASSSPPLSVLLTLMDVPSDDLFADLLAKQLGYRFGGAGTLAAGAQRSPADRQRLRRCTRRSSTAPGSISATARPRRSRRAAQGATAPRPGRVAVGARCRSSAKPARCRHRRQDARPGPLRREDRNAQRRHQPGRLLPAPTVTCSRLRCSLMVQGTGPLCKPSRASSGRSPPTGSARNPLGENCSGG